MTPEERRERLHRAMEQNSRGELNNPVSDMRVRSESSYGSEKKSRRQSAAGSGRPADTLRRDVSASSRSSRRSSSGTSAGRSAANRRRKKKSPFLPVLLVVFLILLLSFIMIRFFSSDDRKAQEASEAVLEMDTDSAAETSEEETIPEETVSSAENILTEARRKKSQYDYDGALELLSDPALSGSEDAAALLSEIEEEKETLVLQDPSKVTHVFFHILSVDPKNSFDSSRWGKQAGGYNGLMTTVSEFEKILSSMYEKGFVLVSLHDLGHMETAADGTEKMVPGKIMLPPGKKAFVMSEDDVCYYEYMKGAGFAECMVIGDDGKPALRYTDANGVESVGAYDLVPLLDRFIEEHPDFSYHGHKACLVFTGYNGILGYRTDETYLPENYEKHGVEGGHDVEAERKEAVRVLKALAEDGYDLGSHSWGHRDMGEISFDNLKTDMDKWEKNVNSLIREATGKGADILIYPKGADIGDWRGYTASEQGKKGCREKFNYLYQQGFRYFCNVDSAQYWVQFGDQYLRTGRRPLDGYNFWKEISDGRGRFSDLWDNTSAIFDSARPTPVPAY